MKYRKTTDLKKAMNNEEVRFSPIDYILPRGKYRIRIEEIIE